MYSLAELIESAKKNDENAMLEIINRFKPIIDKYLKKLCYDKDAKSILELKLIEVVKLELKLDNLRDCGEGTLVNYIVSSLYHKYLEICGKTATLTTSELLCEQNILYHLSDSQNFFREKNIENYVFFESLRKILTEREFDCVYYIAYMGYTSEEISKHLNITKQACNQCKLRAFRKIRAFF